MIYFIPNVLAMDEQMIHLRQVLRDVNLDINIEFTIVEYGNSTQSISIAYTTDFTSYCLSFVKRSKQWIYNRKEQYFDQFEQINLEQYEKLNEENNMNNLPKQPYNDTDDQVLTNMLRSENVVNINQLLSSFAVSRYANDRMIDIMSIEMAKCTVDHSSTCVDGEETFQPDCIVECESFSDIDVPDQPSPKSDLVTTQGKHDQVMAVSESNGLDDSQEDTDKKGVINRDTEQDSNIIDTQTTKAQTIILTKIHAYIMDNGEDSHVEKQINKEDLTLGETDTEIDTVVEPKGDDINCCDTVCYYCGVF